MLELRRYLKLGLIALLPLSIVIGLLAFAMHMWPEIVAIIVIGFGIIILIFALGIIVDVLWGDKIP